MGKKQKFFGKPKNPFKLGGKEKELINKPNAKLKKMIG